MVIIEIIFTIIVEVIFQIFLCAIGASIRWAINPRKQFKSLFNDQPRLNAVIGVCSIVIIIGLIAAYY